LYSTSYSIFCHYILSIVLSCNDTSTTWIYALSLHDALPISRTRRGPSITSDSAGTISPAALRSEVRSRSSRAALSPCSMLLDLRSEEHTSELQSRENLVCRLLLEKKKKKYLKK